MASTVSCPCFHPRAWRLAAWLAVALAVPAHAETVIVVTDSRHPVRNAQGARVIELDRPAALEAALSAQLGADPAASADTVRARLVHGGAELQRDMAQAYQGVVDAWSLGIAKIPAVVVLAADHPYVVYGEPDAARAIARIAAYRRTPP